MCFHQDNFLCSASRRTEGEGNEHSVQWTTPTLYPLQGPSLSFTLYIIDTLARNEEFPCQFPNFGTYHIVNTKSVLKHKSVFKNYITKFQDFQSFQVTSKHAKYVNMLVKTSKNRLFSFIAFHLIDFDRIWTITFIFKTSAQPCIITISPYNYKPTSPWLGLRPASNPLPSIFTTLLPPLFLLPPY